MCVWRYTTIPTALDCRESAIESPFFIVFPPALMEGKRQSIHEFVLKELALGNDSPLSFLGVSMLSFSCITACVFIETAKSRKGAGPERVNLQT